MSVLVGLQAPDFTAEAVVDGNFEDIKLSSYRDKSYVVLFFYPMDFTSVCNTEMHAFAITYDEFKKRDAEVLACSVDSKFSHLAWLKTPKNKGGIEGTKFPIRESADLSILSLASFRRVLFFRRGRIPFGDHI